MTTLLAMHGWAGDSRGWAPFAAAAAARGWLFAAHERGYGARPRLEPGWPAAAPVPGVPAGPRVLIAHSFGPHLLPEAVLAQAEAVVLLASFGRFVPEGNAGRRLRTALAGMAAALEGNAEEATAMLSQFLSQATAPLPLQALPCSILDQPLAASGQALLLRDLRRLEACLDLPAALPRQAPCLIVEAGDDRIVAPAARAALRQALPAADRLVLQGAGHTLLASPVLPMVLGWIETLEQAWEESRGESREEFGAPPQPWAPEQP